MRRKLSDTRLQLRALHMGGRWLRKWMIDEKPEAHEDEGDSLMLDEALKRVHGGPVMPRLGDPDDSEEDLHVV